MEIKVMSRIKAIEHSIKSDIKKCIIVSINSLDSDSTYFYYNEKIIDILPLYFNDIERDYGESIAPRQEDFIGLKEFIDTHKDNVDEIIVHCAAGISRSSAVAAAICQYLDLDEFNTIWNCHNYIPNSLVYKLALRELGLEWNEGQFAYYLAMNKLEREKQDLPVDILQLF